MSNSIKGAKMMEIKSVIGTENPVYPDAIAIRRTVFIGEQGVSEALELDGQDEDVKHYVGYVDGQAVATARIKPLFNQRVKIQRVATLKAARHHGYNTQIIKRILSDAQDEGFLEAVLDAQETALGFYQKMGFVITSEPFLEANIKHRKMTYNLVQKKRID